MFNSLLKQLFFIVLFVVFTTSVSAQVLSTEELGVPPAIQANDVVEVNKSIIFDVSSPELFYPDKPVEYKWDFGDKSAPDRGEEVVHTFTKTGAYTVTVTMKQEDLESTTQHEVFVYSKLMIFLLDSQEQVDTLSPLMKEALDSGVYIKQIDSFDSTSTAFMSEETLSQKVADSKSILGGAESITIWTEQSSGINALTRLVQSKPEMLDVLKDKTLVVISDKNLNMLSRIMRSNFSIIQPKQILLVREHQIRNLIASDSVDSLISMLRETNAVFEVINAESARISVLNMMSTLVNFMIANGIPSNTIVLLLMLTVIVTIITFIKQIIGFGTLGIYSTSIITLSFLALGLQAGLTIIAVIVVTGVIFRKILDRFRLLYNPRVAVILCLSTIVILGLLAFGSYFDSKEIASMAVFPMLVMTTMAEKFTNALSGRGFKRAVVSIFETVAVSLICYSAVESQYLQTFILAYPEIILVFILINIFLGKWTGLRLTEYFRFREVMQHTEEE